MDVKRLAAVVIALAATGAAIYLTLNLAAGDRRYELFALLSFTLLAAGWSLSPNVSPSPYGRLDGAPPDQGTATPANPRGRYGTILLVLAFGLAAFAIPFYYMRWKILLPLWLVACVLGFIGATWVGTLGPPATAPVTPTAVRYRHLALFAVCLIAAAFLRLYRIGELPPGLFVDEGNIAMDALWLLDGRPDSPFWVGWYETPTLYGYYLAGLIKVGGPNVLTLKLASIIPGILAVAAMYPLGRILFGAQAALVASFMLAISRWHVTFSRWGWNAMMPPFFQISSTALLLYAFATRRAIHYFVAGFVLGLGMYTYLASRLVVLTLFAYVAIRIVFERGFFKRQLGGLVIFSLGYMICFGPLLMTYAHSSFSFLNRTQQVSVFQDIAEVGNWSPLISNIKVHLLMFHGVGDGNARHNLPDHPMLAPVAGVLLLLGCGLALWRFIDHRFVLLILWIVIAMLGGILTNAREAPQAYRTFGVVPAICLLSAAAADAWTRTLGRIRLLYPLALLALVGALGFAAYTTYREYFVDFERDPRITWAFSPGENGVAQRVLAERKRMGDVSHVYLSPRLYYYSPLRYLLYEPFHDGHQGVEDPVFHMMEPQADLPLSADGRRDVLLLLDPEVGQTLLVLQDLYPHLSARTVMSDNQPLYTEVNIPKEDVLAVRRLAAHDVDGTPLPDTSSDQGFIARLTALAPGQSLVGAYKVPLSGVYEIISDASVDVFIDGAKVTGAIRIGQGLHDLRLTRTAVPGTPTILVQRPGKAAQPLDPDQLFRVSAPRSGLRGWYYSGAEWQGEPLFERVDPVIAFTWPGEEPIEGAFSIRWTGQLRAPADGEYFFEMHCDDGCGMTLDGKKIFGVFQEGVQVLQTRLPLTAGLHDLIVDYVQIGGGKSIRFSWRPPGGELGLVPPDVFVPDPPSWPSVTASPADEAAG